jgi:hypothetical protein
MVRITPEKKLAGTEARDEGSAPRMEIISHNSPSTASISSRLLVSSQFFL